MLRPRWIGVLVLALVVAGVFAFLGQWQLERAIDTEPPPGRGHRRGCVRSPTSSNQDSICPNPTSVSVSRPPEAGSQATSWSCPPASTTVPRATGSPVSSGSMSAPRSRSRSAGPLIARSADAAASAAGRARSPAPTRRSPAASSPTRAPVRPTARRTPIGWTGCRRPCCSAAARHRGARRVSPVPRLDRRRRRTRRHVLPAPDGAVAVNWLNIFYAVEWAIFAGFAFYLWYRLAKDAWEREVEEFEDAMRRPAIAIAHLARARCDMLRRCPPSSGVGRPR